MRNCTSQEIPAFFIISCWCLSHAFLPHSLGPLHESEGRGKTLIRTQNGIFFSEMASGNFKVQQILSFKEISLPSVFCFNPAPTYNYYCTVQLQETTGLPTTPSYLLSAPMHFLSWGMLARTSDHGSLWISNGHFLLIASTLKRDLRKLHSCLVTPLAIKIFRFVCSLGISRAYPWRETNIFNITDWQCTRLRAV